ncbi:MAG TPA: diguanylate cyclase [Burkholderiales bacterium]|nr:diguanylate cyclase [Burkholderiales bacterium]
MAPATEQAKRRVLVVDDSKFVRKTFATILRGSFDVREEADGEAAWSAIEGDRSIVMVFTDLDMPKLNGFGLLARMRASTDARIRELPVVVISGVEEQANKQRARAAGAHDFIAKSADAAEVLARLDNVMRLVSTRKELEAAREVRGVAAARDRLTGTLTGQYLLTESRKRFSFVRRHGGDLAVMALRIANLREVTRSAGKEAADQVLSRIAKLVSSQIREEDSIARTAADTFMVVAPATSAAQMQMLAERLRAQLEQAKLSFGKQPLHIVSRVGVASLGADAVGSIEELMRAALQRLDTPQPVAVPAPAAAQLPAEVEQALQTLERADIGRTGEAATELLKRLHRIAKLIHDKRR